MLPSVLASVAIYVIHFTWASLPKIPYTAASGELLNLAQAANMPLYKMLLGVNILAVLLGPMYVWVFLSGLKGADWKLGVSACVPAIFLSISTSLAAAAMLYLARSNIRTWQMSPPNIVEPYGKLSQAATNYALWFAPITIFLIIFIVLIGLLVSLLLRLNMAEHS